MAQESTDRIEKRILLRAPRARVWKAVADAEEFGKWFGVDLSGQKFAPGQITRGPVLHEGYRHLTWKATVEDPVVFTKPWEITPRTLRLNPNPKALLEEDPPCLEQDGPHIVTDDHH